LVWTHLQPLEAREGKPAHHRDDEHVHEERLQVQESPGLLYNTHTHIHHVSAPWRHTTAEPVVRIIQEVVTWGRGGNMEVTARRLTPDQVKTRGLGRIAAHFASDTASLGVPFCEQREGGRVPG